VAARGEHGVQHAEVVEDLQGAGLRLASGGDGTGRTVTDEEAVETLTEVIYRGIAGSPPAGRGGPEGGSVVSRTD
jgi:hypothetical protein